MISVAIATRRMNGVRTRWQDWVAASHNRKILSAAVIIGAFTLGAKVVSLGREQYVAAIFGTSDALDAYLVAIIMPITISSIVASAFNAALIPTYIQVRQHKGREEAHRLLSSVMFLSLLLLGAVTALFALMGPLLFPYLASGFNSHKLDLTRNLAYIMMPMIMVTGAMTLCSAVLNADERFALPALSAVAVPIVAILSLLVGFRPLGIYALAIGMMLGLVAQLIWVTWGMRKQSLPIFPRWHGNSSELRLVIGQYLPMVAGQLVFSVGAVIDQGMAATLRSGSVSTLTYGDKLIALILGIGTMALGTAVLPYFSEMVAAEDWASVRHTLRVYIRLILVVSIPITLLLLLFSRDIVQLLFQRGEFSRNDTMSVSRVMMMYALQIPFYSLGILLVRLLSSLKMNQWLLYVGFIGLFLNFSLDYILKGIMGVSGIALSTSIVYVVTLICHSIVTRRALRHRVRT